tara:strand:+ start:937 stop:1593 length:657 start_codon:yes stop_codon:yes gene_type:complete
MRIRLVIAASLIILLTTINSKQNFVVSTFSLKKIIIENNLLLTDKDIKSLLVPIYDKNLLFLENDEVKKALMQSSYIASFNIQKKYPSTLKIKIFEKKPIAILLNNKKKFYLSERIDLIEFKKIPNYQNLPYIFGNREDFKIFYNNLKKINFPFEIIKKYILYETNRWDLETKNNKIIMLPSQNYIKSLKNYLNLKNKNGFERYELFDYRISNQLILK